MKAKDYFNRDIEKIKTAIEKQDQKMLDDIATEIYRDFNKEVHEITKTRNVKFYRGFVSIIKELNAKWNSLARMIEKEVEIPILQIDGFKNALAVRLPGLDKLMNLERN